MLGVAESSFTGHCWKDKLELRAVSGNRFDDMTQLAPHSDAIGPLAPAGYYVALRVGFSFPEQELNRLPARWIDFYTTRGLVVHDPAMKWVYAHTGMIRMAEIGLPDPFDVRGEAAAHGLAHGAVISVLAQSERGRRSYGFFFRDDRAYDETELLALLSIMQTLHKGPGDEPSLTAAEIRALALQGQGLRLKQVASQLGISESAVKARLNNAKRKLGAKTLSQAATIAAARRLI